MGTIENRTLALGTLGAATLAVALTLSGCTQKNGNYENRQAGGESGIQGNQEPGATATPRSALDRPGQAPGTTTDATDVGGQTGSSNHRPSGSGGRAGGTGGTY